MVRAFQFIKEEEHVDSTAVNELDIYINNNEELYRKQFMPIISNLKRKLNKGIYNHDKAQKLWMYLIDNGAKEYVKEFESGKDVKDIFPKDLRLELAKIMADRELENIKQGEYDVTQGTVT
jgi:hypothetical protein